MKCLSLASESHVLEPSAPTALWSKKYSSPSNSSTLKLRIWHDPLRLWLSCRKCCVSVHGIRSPEGRKPRFKEAWRHDAKGADLQCSQDFGTFFQDVPSWLWYTVMVPLKRQVNQFQQLLWPFWDNHTNPVHAFLLDLRGWCSLSSRGDPWEPVSLKRIYGGIDCKWTVYHK